MTNVNAAALELVPNGGTSNVGWKIALVDSAAKAAQNDTVTVTNANNVQVVSAIDDTTGAFESHTVSGNVITLTSATAGAKTLTVLIK